MARVLSSCRLLRLQAAASSVAPRAAATRVPAGSARGALAARALFTPRADRRALAAAPQRATASRRAMSARAASGVAKGDAVGGASRPWVSCARSLTHPPLVRFTARTLDGRVVDSSSSARGEAFFVVGEEPPRVPGLDVAVTGLTKGAKATKTVPAAFGPRSDDAIIRIPAAMAPPGLEAGDSVRMGDGSPGLITSVSASEVVVDVNHPLAGQDVVLEVELVAHTPADKLQFFVGGLVRICRAAHAARSAWFDAAINYSSLQGCFWGPELAFARVPGVMSTAVGYANGSTPDPTYEAVCSGATGHAEVVRIAFDPEAVSFDALLEVFWTKHNPTQVNRQGNDVGTQYRSCILAANDAQLAVARASAEKEAARRGVKALATEIELLKCYYRAEEYHQARAGLDRSGFDRRPVLTRSCMSRVASAAIPGEGRAQRQRAKPRQAVQRPHPLLWLMRFECNVTTDPGQISSFVF